MVSHEKRAQTSDTWLHTLPGGDAHMRSLLVCWFINAPEKRNMRCLCGCALQDSMDGVVEITHVSP